MTKIQQALNLIFLILIVGLHTLKAEGKSFLVFKNGYAVTSLQNVDEQDQDASSLYLKMNARPKNRIGFIEKDFMAFNSTFILSCRIGQQGFANCTAKLIMGPYTTISPDKGKAIFQVSGEQEVAAIYQQFNTDANGQFEFKSFDRKTYILLTKDNFTYYVNENGID